MIKPLLATACLSLLAACASTTTENTTPQTKETTAMSMPDVTIYHLEGRRSERIVWLMEELGLPYELEYVRGNLQASMDQVRALGHEMPMVPTVVIGDQILVESGSTGASAGERALSDLPDVDALCRGLTRRAPFL